VRDVVVVGCLCSPSMLQTLNISLLESSSAAVFKSSSNHIIKAVGLQNQSGGGEALTCTFS